MTEYLKNYKKLLELGDINEKEIKENEQLITDNSQKLFNTRERSKINVNIFLL